MPRNFNFNFRLPSATTLREPQVLVRVALGVLLLANLIAAAIAFHFVGDSPETLNQQLAGALAEKQTAQAHLNRSRALTGNIEKGKGEGERFLSTYMTTRRYTFSTIIGELNETSKASGMKMQDATIAPLDPIEGSEDLDMMTLSVNFEGGYAELVKFVNLLDRSRRFLIIESLTVTPRPKGEVLVVNVRLNTFVKEDKDGNS
jgi:Tfp pilus assembly protein PilO